MAKFPDGECGAKNQVSRNLMQKGRLFDVRIGSLFFLFQALLMCVLFMNNGDKKEDINCGMWK